MRRIRTLFFLVVLTIAGPARPEILDHLPCCSDVSRIDSLPRSALRERTAWYGVYFEGRRCGWARITHSYTKTDDTDKFVIEMESNYRTTAIGTALTDYVTERQEFTPTPPYRLVKGSYRRVQNGEVVAIALKRYNGGYQAIVQEASGTRTLPISSLDYSVLDDLTVQQWVQEHPSVGQQLKVRSFSLQDLELAIDTYQIVFSGKKRVGAGEQPVLETTRVSSLRGNAGRFTFDAAGRILSVSQGDAFEMRLESEQQAKRTESAADFLSDSAVRIDRALGTSPTDVASLVLDVTGNAASDLASGPGFIVTRNTRDTSCTLVTGCTQTPEIWATQADIAKNLVETLDYPVNDPQIRRLAAEVADGKADDWNKTCAMVTFVYKSVSTDDSPRTRTVKETIKKHKGDCTERAALLVTLARANGIPAREVYGLMYTSDIFRSFAGHSWCEVVIDGRWVPVDPSWEQMCIDGTHIRFDSGRKGMNKLLSSMGGLSFHLVRVTPRPAAATEDRNPRHKSAPPH